MSFLTDWSWCDRPRLVHKLWEVGDSPGNQRVDLTSSSNYSIAIVKGIYMIA